MDINKRIAGIAERLTPQLVELRKTLHQRPELAFEEHETAKAVTAFLTKLGIPFRTGIGKTGVVAVLEGSAPGRTIGLASPSSTTWSLAARPSRTPFVPASGSTFVRHR